MQMLNLNKIDEVENSAAEKEAVFAQLMSSAGSRQNDFYLARILSSWLTNNGVLPAALGMEDDDFRDMVANNFNNHALLSNAADKPLFDRERVPEWEDVVNLLLEYRAGTDVSEKWVAQIVAAACMGFDHLWQDLGLWNRSELSQLFVLNFPELANRNTKDMKWKKFLYKQLCERDGTYVCRAPSCDVCADYKACFGPEE
jgi:nitrogen fixation protein NifQ